jgi:hypothetical protein
MITANLSITTAKQSGESKMFRPRQVVYECQELHKHKHRVSAYQLILLLLMLLHHKETPLKCQLMKAVSTSLDLLHTLCKLLVEEHTPQYMHACLAQTNACLISKHVHTSPRRNGCGVNYI